MTKGQPHPLWEWTIFAFLKSQFSVASLQVPLPKLKNEPRDKAMNTQPILLLLIYFYELLCCIIFYQGKVFFKKQTSSFIFLIFVLFCWEQQEFITLFFNWHVFKIWCQWNHAFVFIFKNNFPTFHVFSFLKVK